MLKLGSDIITKKGSAKTKSKDDTVVEQDKTPLQIAAKIKRMKLASKGPA